MKERHNEGQCVVEGLSREELLQITTGPGDTERPAPLTGPGARIRRVELTASGCSVLNALEQLGYRFSCTSHYDETYAFCRVVSSCSFISNSNTVWGSKYLVWTLHKT